MCVFGYLNKGVASEDGEILFFSCVATREGWSEKGISFEAALGMEERCHRMPLVWESSRAEV